MHKLSTGQDSTLGQWRSLTVIWLGEDSPAVAFLDEKIAAVGEDEEVLADERQFIYALMSIHTGVTR